ncbi:AfsR/SARP family transcriptional regulator [Catenuloplanes japonicus]|uniref:AfsR/SARP family transcriptional regulator n=1 Tax=Catenuloplanes japonicus TaxID=33876 RepID=UPI00052500F4|nr:BTAD domain-containing putative transcriptional regulator [Catenuloplanes japonicus]
MASHLELQLLGPLRLWRDGVELDTGQRQQTYLLALLAARAGRPVSTAELIGMIWEDDAPASAVNIIQKYIGALRRLLEPGLPVRGAGSYLVRHAAGYLFTAAPDMLDITVFRELIADARTMLARQRPAEALGTYARALELWRGPSGDGTTPGPRAMPVFAALDDEFLDACVAASRLAVAQGRPELVLRSLRLAASMAPLHETVQAALIAVLDAAGRHAEALSVFPAVRARLAEELGTDPGPVLQAAHRSALRRTPDVVTGTGPRPGSRLMERLAALLREEPPTEPMVLVLQPAGRRS